jgi:Zn-dependent M16 (insulinase) family peptidase
MFQYLWDNIRVKNGAYGAFWTLNKNYEYGVFGSYSDPKLNETYKTYLNTKKKYDISKFKNYSFEKMKLKFLSKEKIIFRNANLYSNAFSFFVRGISDAEREKSLAKKTRINFVDFKSLINNVLDYSFNIKVIATTPDRMKAFSEKYQEIDLN